MGDTRGGSGVLTAELKWTSISSSSSIAGSGTASLFNLVASRCDFRLFRMVTDFIATW